jgi:hypothetical protein
MMGFLLQLKCATQQVLHVYSIADFHIKRDVLATSIRLSSNNRNKKEQSMTALLIFFVVVIID